MIISVILPTYNEKGHIVKLIHALHTVSKKIHKAFEIIVVDDNSPDKTAEIVQKTFIRNKQIKVFVRTRDRGLAASILFGLQKAKGTYCIVMDTDFSHNPSVIPFMLQKISQADMIIGSRYVTGGGMVNRRRYYLSKLFNMFLKILLGIHVSDFLSGYFCVRREFLVKNKLLQKRIFSGYGDYFIDLIAQVKRAKGTFLEVPSFYIDRSYGESKSNLPKLLVTYSQRSFKLFLQQKNSSFQKQQDEL